MPDEIVVPVRFARSNFHVLRGAGVEVNGRLRLEYGVDTVYEFHVSGVGPDPFPVEGDAPGD